MFEMKWICGFIFKLLFLLDGGVWSLRDVSLIAPTGVLAGSDVILTCTYDLEGIALYSIRWYRGDTEFYRYVPRELPPALVFPFPGATVDLSRSDAQRVALWSLSRTASGIYACEVSADAPSFHTEIKAAPITVVDPPLSSPRLSLSRSLYSRGGTLVAECSSEPGYPAPNITWTVDGQTIAQCIGDTPPDNDFTPSPTHCRLELRIRDGVAQDFTYSSGNVYQYYTHDTDEFHKPPPKGTVRTSISPPAQFSLRCVAHCLDVWSRASEVVSVREDAPQPASVTRDDSGAASHVVSSVLVTLALIVLLL